MIKAVFFDFGHTIVDELTDRGVPLRRRRVHLMPGVAETIPTLTVQMGIWANTRKARAPGIRALLKRAEINGYFKWVATSTDAGYRKPDRRFFDYALAGCGLGKDEIMFIGNQLNTDIRGANSYGIANVWLAGPAYRSPDDDLSTNEVTPTHTIESITYLPGLLARLGV